MSLSELFAGLIIYIALLVGAFVVLVFLTRR